MTQTRRRSGIASDLFELLSSMRFAIGLLTVLAIASVIGTVLKQNEPYPNYVVEFGQFWFDVFETLGLYDVYHSGWFLVILLFLVVSTSLCIWRNGPGFIKDMKGFREKASANSLAAMSHSAEIGHALDPAATRAWLQSQGFRIKEQQRDDGALMLAGKKGAANKLGYFLAHIALVVICLGGLMDGNVPLKFAELIGSAKPETRDLPQSQIPPASRLSTANLSFRGNVTVPENRSADVVFLNAGRGYFVQELPFIVTLKKFHVDYYSNGMPRLFASDIVVTDKQSGRETEATVKVNHPLTIDGVSIYQSSFGDGGSPLKFQAWDLTRPTGSPTALDGLSMASQPLKVDGSEYALEFGELRPFNIENMGSNSTVAVNKSLNDALAQAGNVKHEKQVRNLGPTIQFKLRDNKGQATEYLNYMAPVQLEGHSYLITGMRREVGQPFGFMRFPLDDQGSIQRYMRLKDALQTPAYFDEVARRAAIKAQAGGAVTADMASQFAGSVKWVLNRFADGGFAALESFLDERVPADKRQAVAQTYVKILQGVIVDLMDVADEKTGVKPAVLNEQNYRFLLDGLVAFSASKDYGSPVYLQLSGFDEVKASGLQLTRSPGKNVVYLGSLLLVAGIIFMFYVRELRIWVLIRRDGTRMAMASNRKTSDLDRDFARHLDHLQNTSTKG